MDKTKLTLYEIEFLNSISWCFKWLLMVFILCLIFSCQTCQAYTTADEIKAIIGEAEGEPQQGKEAIACAIHNRGTLKGVYGLHAPRVRNKLYSYDTWQNAVVAVYMAQDQEYCDGLIHGAQYWEGLAFKKPYWAYGMTETAVIGNQVFYRKGN